VFFFFSFERILELLLETVKKELVIKHTEQKSYN